jgi:hypothetical protein
MGYPSNGSDPPLSSYAQLILVDSATGCSHDQRLVIMILMHDSRVVVDVIKGAGTSHPRMAAKEN